jgi:hypothetical protein
MGLLDKLLGRDAKPAAEPKAETAPATAAPLTQRDDTTSPHHHAEQEADA